MRWNDLTGRKFGRLTAHWPVGKAGGPTYSLSGRKFDRVRAAAYRPSSAQVVWLATCDCGNSIEVFAASLTSGNTRSCGCLKNERSSAQLRGNQNNLIHGHLRKKEKTREYKTWQGMIARCSKPSNPSYRNYGARGITVCDRWKIFTNFLADMGPRPEGRSLDRYPNNDGNYELGNCRWATRKEQAANCRRRKDVEREKLRRRAYGRMWGAIRAGRLVRKPCEVCGNPEVDGHHDDYSLPLKVRWLCRKHHKKGGTK